MAADAVIDSFMYVSPGCWSSSVFLGILRNSNEAYNFSNRRLSLNSFRLIPAWPVSDIAPRLTILRRFDTIMIG
jgi:hypothetical protein